MYTIKHLQKVKRWVINSVFCLIFICVIYNTIKAISVKQSMSIPHENGIMMTGKPQQSMNQYWIVSFSSKDRCIEIVTAFPGNWVVLLAGEVPQPAKGSRHSRCVYFSEVKDTQMNLTASDKKHLSRTMLPFIFAIQNGASGIYILPSDDEKRIEYPNFLEFKSSITAMKLYTNGTVFHPFIHLGCNISQTPFDSHGNATFAYSYKLCDMIQPVIQTESYEIISTKVSDDSLVYVHLQDFCDQSSPAIAISSNTQILFEMQGTLFMKDAFWALGLFYDNEVDKLLRSSLVNKLVSMSGRDLMVHTGPVIPTARSSFLTNTKLDALIGIQPCSSNDFLSCILKTINYLHETGNLHSTDPMKTWLYVLQSIKYQVQLLQRKHEEEHCKQPVQYQPVDYNVPYRIQKWKPNPFPPINNINQTKKLYENLCSNLITEAHHKPDFLSPWIQWENVLLIIVFNNPLYGVIPVIEMLYRPFFPHILYCGPENLNISNFDGHEDYSFSFVSYGKTPAGHANGAFNYQCISLAVKMRYSVAGYLVIADDLLLIPSKLRKLSLEKAWHLERQTADVARLRLCRLGNCDFHTHWVWWEDYQSATLNVLKELHSNFSKSTLLQQCSRSLKGINGGITHANGGFSDIYYIPQYIAQDFAQLADIFIKHFVFLEIAVPTIFTCLVPDNEMETLLGKALWDVATRDKPWLFFTKKEIVSMSYLHPTKWSGIKHAPLPQRQLLCNAMSYLHDPYERINKVERL